MGMSLEWIIKTNFSNFPVSKREVLYLVQIIEKNLEGSNFCLPDTCHFDSRQTHLSYPIHITFQDYFPFKDLLTPNSSWHFFVCFFPSWEILTISYTPLVLQFLFRLDGNRNTHYSIYFQVGWMFIEVSIHFYLQGSISNIIEENVLQPLLVSTSAITLAAECVRSILKIDDIVSIVFP